jgi:hypothetical protein
MRNMPAVIWLLIGIGVSLVVSRVGRPLGLVGGVLAIVLVMVVIGVAWEVVRTRARARGTYQPMATTKNVTPREPALPAGDSRPPEVSAAVSWAPSVIVVEPPDGADVLGARLQALDRLRADGLVTDQEYEAKRAQLIADF